MGCPSVRTLEALALHGTGSDAVRTHAETCVACRAAMVEIRENQAFLARAAAALAVRPGPASPLSPVQTPAATPAEFGAPDQAASIVPGYELGEEISRGGQGVVYRAVQTATKRPAAVKVLLAGAFATEKQRRRFEREVEVAAMLRHPNVVSVFDSGTLADGSPYVAMELVAGVPVDAFLRGRFGGDAHGRSRHAGRERASKSFSTLEVHGVLGLFSLIVSGVAHAHERGVIHRDLKPSNILVDAHGTPRVLDFGLARPIATIDRPETTRTLEFAGTPAYAAPEQFAGGGCGPSAGEAEPVLGGGADGRRDVGGTIGTTADVYALGVMMYEALTGRLPYPCDGTFAEIARHAAATEPMSPSRLEPPVRLPRDVETIVMKCLSKDPSRRYRSAGSLGADLQDYLAGRPISARRDSTWYVVRKTAMRHRRSLALGGAAALTVATLGTSLWVNAARLRQEQAASQLLRVARERLGALGRNTLSAEAALWSMLLEHPGRSTYPTDRSEQARAWALSPDSAAPAWALAEFYTREPRVLTVQTARADVKAGAAQLWFEPTGDAAPTHVGVTYEDGARRAWRLDDGTEETEHPAILRGAAWPLASGEHVAISPDGATAAIWNSTELRIHSRSDDRTPRARTALEGDTIVEAAWDSRAGTLATTMASGGLRLWTVQDGTIALHADFPQPHSPTGLPQTIVSRAAFVEHGKARAVLAASITSRLYWWPTNELGSRPKGVGRSVFLALPSDLSYRRMQDLQVSPDHAWFAAAFNEPMAGVNLLNAGKVLRSEPDPMATVTFDEPRPVRVAFSGDTRHLFVADSSGRWTATPLEKLLDDWQQMAFEPKMSKLDPPTKSMQFGPASVGEPSLIVASHNGRMLAMGDREGLLSVWDTSFPWYEVLQEEGPVAERRRSGTPRSLAFEPTRSIVAIAESDPARLRVIDCSDRGGSKKVRYVASHEGARLDKVASAVRILPGGRLMASVGYDGMIVLRPVDTLTVLLSMNPGLERLHALEHDRLGDILIATGDLGVVAYQLGNADLTEGEDVSEGFKALGFAERWRRSDLVPTGVQAISPADAAGAAAPILAVAIRSTAPGASSLLLLDARTGRNKQAVQSIMADVSAAAFSPDGARLAVATADRTLTIVQTADGGIAARSAILPAPILSVAYHPSGRLIFAAQHEPALLVYDASSTLELARLALPPELLGSVAEKSLGPRRTRSGHIDLVAISPDGATLFTATNQGSVARWDLRRLLTAVGANAPTQPASKR